MSIINLVQQQMRKVVKKTLQLSDDFTHPVGGNGYPNAHTNDNGHHHEDSAHSSGEHYEPLADHARLPHTDEWSQGYPTTTYIDPDSQLLTTHTDGIEPIDEHMTIYHLYEQRAEQMPDKPLYSFRIHNRWITKTASEFLAEVRSCAKGLICQGVHKGDSVALMCHTSYQWNIIDAAVLACGGVLASIYETDATEQIVNIINNADAKLLIVETQEMQRKARAALEECPTLERIYCLETGALSELQAYSSIVSDEELDARIASVGKTDLCSIVYTSGSTAAPKGVQMTHEHYCTTALNLRQYLPALLGDEQHSALLFLPQAHSFARAVNYIMVASALHIYIAQGTDTLIADLQVAQPSVMIVVPRVLEKLYNAASYKAGRGLKSVTFASAVLSAQRYMRQLVAHGKANALCKAQHCVYDPLVYKPLRQALGGKAQWIVTGGAPLDPDLLTFFRGANIPVYEGYGLTETTAPCAFTPPNLPLREGSVGIAFPGFSIRIAHDHEIQVKGTAVFPRYHKNTEASELSFTEDGWYATGDLGVLDHQGFLTITGRKKDIIITSGGKNIVPSVIERTIARCPLVCQALVLGDKRPFISALVTLNEQQVRLWLASKGLDSNMPLEQVATNPIVRNEIQQYIDKANSGISRAESVRKFIVLPNEFTQEDGLLTPSLKIIRRAVLERYATLLDTEMY